MASVIVLGSGDPSNNSINYASQVTEIVIGYGSTSNGVGIYLWGRNFGGFPLLTSVSPDGWHNLRLVAQQTGSTGSFNVYVDNNPVANNPYSFPILSDAHGLNAIEVYSNHISNTPPGIGYYLFDNISLTAAAARSIKENVLGDLTGLLAGTRNKRDAHTLNEAIKHLGKSLDWSFWVDGNHVDPKDGDKVFKEESDAVGGLKELAKNGLSTQDYIASLVGADRLLAQTAINDALADTGNPKEVAKALDELAKGDKEAGSGKPVEAIDHYCKAWQHAEHALK